MFLYAISQRGGKYLTQSNLYRTRQKTDTKIKTRIIAQQMSGTVHHCTVHVLWERVWSELKLFSRENKLSWCKDLIIV